MLGFRAILDNLRYFPHLNIFKIMTFIKALLYKITFTGSRYPELFWGSIQPTADIIRIKYNNEKGLRMRFVDI